MMNEAKEMIQEFYDELDATICNCMAAGVSADQLILTSPDLTTMNHSVKIICHIGFKPESIG